MIIHPEVIVTPDYPTIKFREPRELVDLDRELPRILTAQGWGCGTYFNVQFLSHERTRLLATALYVVTEETEALHTSEENPYQPVTKTVYTRRAERIGEWWCPGDGTEPQTGVAGVGNGKVTAMWNPGRKMHQVKIGDRVVYETADKKEAKEMADGKIPIPDAA